MTQRLLRLLRTDAFWRYTDAFSPRIFALGLHTLVLWAFGSALYGLAAWVAAAYGLVAAVMPDPSSYLYVRAHGQRARRLSTLISPVVWAKALLCAGLAWAFGMAMTSDALKAAAHGEAGMVLAGASVYGASEFLWMYAGMAGFASDQTRKVALLGLTSRAAGLLMAVAAHLWLHLPFAWLMVVYSVPTCIAVWTQCKPFSRFSRVWTCYHQSLREYTLWSQGIGLSAAVLAQLLPTGAGMLSSVSASQAGQIAYATRMLSGLVMPFQVLQTVLLKAYTRAGRVETPEVRRMRRIFRGGAIGLMLAFGLAVFVAYLRSKMELDASLAMGLYGACAAVYTWYRYELALRTAGKSIRQVFLHLYLPVMVVSLLLSVPVSMLLGVYGLAVLSGLAWCALAFGARMGVATK